MQDDYHVLEVAIRKAGKRAQTLRQSGLSVTTKGRQDFVSQADIAVEDELRQVIRSLFPEDGFLGEESGLTQVINAKNSGVWVIDPIDGTTNYVQGMDYWCVSVAYVKNNEIQMGFVYAPDRDEFFSAKKGQGAYLNGIRLQINDPEKGQELLGLGRSNRRPVQEYCDLILMLDEQNIEYRRFGAGALMLAHVSSGLVHGYFESHLNSWDALAGLLLIEEAGGRITGFLNNDGLLNGNLVWAASPLLWGELHNWLCKKERKSDQASVD
ncbi:inositol monophosphatase [Marinomonas rhizomae]|uniref:Inositol-1-monophosphatase n=1 Tax=Marinomonas rhizomae TaxID=491948 RepID=A0A366JA65_9GAMM|nr:inositol monophosphatase [Marinomonas rhizomae]RBP83926.1 myo-inositol-1(or 4)-monophosphatase [Marinomonas rhizomae]RNF73371.1 inositol monophosphatase [Marinomonas rhizomae]